MITEQDIDRQHYPELQNKSIQDAYIGELFRDCIEGFIPEFKMAYIVIFGLLVWIY